MIKRINLVKEFHKKFKVPVLKKPSLIPKDRTKLRYELMKEEVEEYFEGVHRSHMSKDYHQYKMIKGKKYFKPNLKKILDK